MCHIASLPPELLGLVAHFYDPVGLAVLVRTCRPPLWSSFHTVQTYLDWQQEMFDPIVILSSLKTLVSETKTLVRDPSSRRAGTMVSREGVSYRYGGRDVKSKTSLDKVLQCTRAGKVTNPYNGTLKKAKCGSYFVLVVTIPCKPVSLIHPRFSEFRRRLLWLTNRNHTTFI